jgi:hypothetical protein
VGRLVTVIGWASFMAQQRDTFTSEATACAQAGRAELKPLYTELAALD